MLIMTDVAGEHGCENSMQKDTHTMHRQDMCSRTKVLPLYIIFQEKVFDMKVQHYNSMATKV